MHRVLSIAVLLAQQPSDYERGVALIEKGTPAEAIEPLALATRAQPGDARAWKALGVAYAALDRYEEAEPAFGKACGLAPRLTDACYYHARALYALNRFEPSLAALGKAGGREWKVLLARAQALEALDRPVEAEESFRAALESGQTQDPGPGVGLGLFLVRQGRINEALGTLGATVDRFPKSTEARIQMGRALLEQGSVKEASVQLEAAITLSPQSSQAHLLLAKAYVRLQRNHEAESHFAAAAQGVK